MKFHFLAIFVVAGRPVPQGAGGLKFPSLRHNLARKASRPVRGGWIEIVGPSTYSDDGSVPSRKGRVD